MARVIPWTPRGSGICSQRTVCSPTGAKIDFPTADFWYLRNGKVEVFDCHIAFTTLFAQLGILPDYASAVAASAPER